LPSATATNDSHASQPASARRRLTSPVSGGTGDSGAGRNAAVMTALMASLSSGLSRRISIPVSLSSTTPPRGAELEHETRRRSSARLFCPCTELLQSSLVCGRDPEPSSRAGRGLVKGSPKRPLVDGARTVRSATLGARGPSSDWPLSCERPGQGPASVDHGGCDRQSAQEGGSAGMRAGSRST
jgi:hypothetical protein